MFDTVGEGETACQAPPAGSTSHGPCTGRPVATAVSPQEAHRTLAHAAIGVEKDNCLRWAGRQLRQAEFNGLSLSVDSGSVCSITSAPARRATAAVSSEQ